MSSEEVQGTMAAHLASLFLGTRSQGRTGGQNHLSKPRSKHLQVSYGGRSLNRCSSSPSLNPGTGNDRRSSNILVKLRSPWFCSSLPSPSQSPSSTSRRLNWTGSNAVLFPATIPSSALVKATSPVYIEMIRSVEEMPLIHVENC
jgi:hypothetical protein